MSLRVWNVINPPSPANLYPVKSVVQAKRLIKFLAEEQLEDEAVISNAFGLQVFGDGEWREWEDDEGRDIEVLMD